MERPAVTTMCGGGKELEFAVASSNGGRPSMKLAHAAFPHLDPRTRTSFFGVYDGVSGSGVCKYCANHPKFSADLASAVNAAFFRMDENMKTKEGRKELTALSQNARGFLRPAEVKRANNDYSPPTVRDWLFSCVCLKEYPGPLYEGCSACVAVIRDDQIIVGNAGSCGCVLSMDGQAVPLSIEHHPGLPDEQSRIINAGSTVEDVNGISTVDGSLPHSRLIGHMSYKSNERLGPEQQAVTCLPDIRFQNITGNTEFLVLGPKALWGWTYSLSARELLVGSLKPQSPPAPTKTSLL